MTLCMSGCWWVLLEKPGHNNTVGLQGQALPGQSKVRATAKDPCGMFGFIWAGHAAVRHFGDVLQDQRLSA
jgi:hypothetical protein